MEFFNTITLFNELGMADELNKYIDDISNISEKDITDELEGLSTNFQIKGTNKSIFDKMSTQEIVDKIKSNASELKKMVNSYSKAAENLDLIAGSENFDEDEKQELLWMMSSVDNWNNRMKQVHESLQEKIAPVLETFKDALYEVEDSEGNNTGLQMSLEKLGTITPTELSSLFTRSSSFRRDIVNAISNTVGEASASIFVTEANDLIRLERAKRNMLAGLNGYIKNPEELKKALRKQKAEAEFKAKERERAKFTNDLNTAATPEEAANILNNADSEQIANLLNEELSDIAKQGVNISKRESIINEITSADPIESIILNAVRGKDNGEPIVGSPEKDIINRVSKIDSAEISSALNIPLQENLEKIETAKQNIIEKLRERERKVKESSEISATIEANDDSESPEVDVTQDFIGDLGVDIPTNTTSVDNTQSTQHTNTGRRKEIIRISGDLSKVWQPAVEEVDFNTFKKNFIIFNNGVQMIQEHPDEYKNSSIYKYLESSGAWDYINSGKLSVGDEVEFMVDPEFTNREDMTKYFPIFITHNKQVIGVLREAKDKFNSGLDDFREAIKREYNTSKRTEPFYYPIKSTIKVLHTGLLEYQEDNRSLSEVLTEEEFNNYDFGISKGGEVVHKNSRVNKLHLSRTGLTAAEEGDVYIYIDSGDGALIPTKLDVARFNTSFNDTGENSNALVERIKKVLNKVVTSTDDNVISAWNELRNILLIPEYIKINIRSSEDTGNFIVISDNRKIEDKLENVKSDISGNTKEDVDRLYNKLKEFNFKFNVKLDSVNDVDYMWPIISANVLLTNLKQLNVRGASFGINNILSSSEKVTPDKTSITDTPIVKPLTVTVGDVIYTKRDGRFYKPDGTELTREDNTENDDTYDKVVFFSLLKESYNSTTDKKKWNDEHKIVHAGVGYYIMNGEVRDTHGAKPPKHITTYILNVMLKIKDIMKDVEFNEGDFKKLHELARLTVYGEVVPSTPENLQLITNYPELYERYIKEIASSKEEKEAASYESNKDVNNENLDNLIEEIEEAIESIGM